MAYELQPGVTFCLTNGHAVFMEVLSGDVFHLGDAANAAFLRILEGQPVSYRESEALEAAVAEGRLKIGETDASLEPCTYPRPTRDEVADWPKTPSYWHAWRGLRRRRGLACRVGLDASPFFVLWGVQNARAAALRKERDARPDVRRRICAAYAYGDRWAPTPEHPLGRATSMAEHLGPHCHRPDLVIGVA